MTGSDLPIHEIMAGVAVPVIGLAAVGISLIVIGGLGLIFRITNRNKEDR